MAEQSSQYIFRFLYESMNAQKAISDAEKAKKATKDFTEGVQQIGKVTETAAEGTKKAWQEMGAFERALRRVLITLPIW
ncbi:MAG: hypothetical protein ACK42G_09975, partial [Candidatus Kapaibacteriota bacterium]